MKYLKCGNCENLEYFETEYGVVIDCHNKEGYCPKMNNERTFELQCFLYPERQVDDILSDEELQTKCDEDMP
jgi:hypothetical protein